MDIYGYYETDANHDQARFSRRWFFAPDSRCKIIRLSYKAIGRDIDLRAFLVESLTRLGPSPRIDMIDVGMGFSNPYRRSRASNYQVHVNSLNCEKKKKVIN